MATLTFSDTAKEGIAMLPRDKTLLTAVWRHLEQAADDPDTFTEPAPFPFRPDRRLCAFRCYNTAGRQWAFSVILAVVEGGLHVTVFMSNPSDDYAEFERPTEFE